jgi:hypothetical protein
MEEPVTVYTLKFGIKRKAHMLLSGLKAPLGEYRESGERG